MGYLCRFAQRGVLPAVVEMVDAHGDRAGPAASDLRRVPGDIPQRRGRDRALLRNAREAGGRADRAATPPTPGPREQPLSRGLLLCGSASVKLLRHADAERRIHVFPKRRDSGEASALVDAQRLGLPSACLEHDAHNPERPRLDLQRVQDLPANAKTPERRCDVHALDFRVRALEATDGPAASGLAFDVGHQERAAPRRDSAGSRRKWLAPASGYRSISSSLSAAMSSSADGEEGVSARIMTVGTPSVYCVGRTSGPFSRCGYITRRSGEGKAVVPERR